MPVLLASVFVSRLLWALLYVGIKGADNVIESDALDYVTLAQSLLHGSFSLNGLPNLTRTPGYPLLLMPAVWSGHVIAFGILENVLLSVFSAWLLARVADELFPGTTVAFWAVLFYCIEPVSFLISTELVTDSLFSALMVLFVWLVVRFLREPSWRTLVTAALVLGAATYTRPISLYLPLWLAPFFLWFPRQLPVRQRLVKSTAFVGIVAMVLAPWFVRNAAVAEYRGFSAIGEIGLYYYSAASIQARLDGKSFAQEVNDMGFLNDDRYFALHPEQRSWPQGKIFHFMRSEARRIIAANWLPYLAIHARGCAVFLFDTVATRILRQVKLYPDQGGLLGRVVDQGVFRGLLWLIREYPLSGLLFLLLGIQLLFYYFLALIGLRAFPVPVASFFVVTAAYFVLVSGGPVGNGRYRMPIIPLICLSAGAAVARIRGSSSSTAFDRPASEERERERAV